MCVPLGIGLAVAVPVTQVCQPPVPLTFTVANGVTVSESRRNCTVRMLVPVSAEAMRACTLPDSPLPKLTPVYSSQLAELIQPTSLPPPASAVASFRVEFCAAYCEAVSHRTRDCSNCCRR